MVYEFWCIYRILFEKNSGSDSPFSFYLKKRLIKQQQEQATQHLSTYNKCSFSIHRDPSWPKVSDIIFPSEKVEEIISLQCRNHLIGNIPLSPMAMFLWPRISSFQIRHHRMTLPISWLVAVLSTPWEILANLLEFFLNSLKKRNRPRRPVGILFLINIVYLYHKQLQRKLKKRRKKFAT